jgi:hypothetical protein
VQIKNGPQSLNVSKIRGKNKKNFEKCCGWLWFIENEKKLILHNHYQYLYQYI